MLTLRAAANLLSQADSLPALAPIVQALGFSHAERVPPATLRTLGIDTLVQRARAARGVGRHRCLCAELSASPMVRPAPVIASAATQINVDSPAVRSDIGSPAAFTTFGGLDARELTRELCVTLAAGAPERDWLVIALDSTLNVLCIALIARHPHGTRVSALRVDRRRVVDSDADTLRALAAITETEPALRFARFLDVLGRDALSARFYRALNGIVTTLAATATGHATPVERRELALLFTSRCLFLAFLEAKGWLNYDPQFLLHHTTACLERGESVHTHFLRPLFFGTLNTPRAQRAPHAKAFGALPFLNGGLFAPTPLERRRRTLVFANDALVALIGDLFVRYRFTAHEDSTQWSEAAIDPEMLGRAFESLMEVDERHQSGTYYTPPELVATVITQALRVAMPALPDNALTNTQTPLALSPETREQLSALRMLDPACGSGAFLVYALEQLASLHARSGDTRPMYEIRRAVLTSSIFGVDRNPIAVWLCELRLWLSMVIECTETDIARIPPLPNLDHHIRVGDSLAGGTFQYGPGSARRLTTLRDKYTRATGTRKRVLAEALDREERQRAIAECYRIADSVQHDRRALLDHLRTRDLFGQRQPRAHHDSKRLEQLKARAREVHTQRRRLELGGALPFRFAAHFADVAANGGFPLIIGNPPWIRPHALPLAERARLKSTYHSMRQAAWKNGAARAGAATGFAAQADVSVAFVEQSGQLLAHGGVMALLVPAKLWRTLSGGGLRHWLHDHVTIRAVNDWSESPALFDAAVYPSLVVAERFRGPVVPASIRSVATASLPLTTNASASNVFPANIFASNTTTTRVPKRVPPLTQVSVHSHRGLRQFTIPESSLSFDGDPAAPWLLLPTAVRTAFDQLRHAGPALGDSPLGRPTLGVKCGCNAAFLVHAEELDDDLARVSATNRHATIERQLLRPALRGEAVAAWGHTPPLESPHHDLRIIWTHHADGSPLRSLPPATTRWLAHWRPRLQRRRDARAKQPWWTLFRTDAARYETPRVVWADIARTMRPVVLPAGDPTVPLNSCYVLRTASLDDAWAICALLSSPVAAAWFAALAEPARGGFHRYMGWTVATLPVPRDWLSVRPTLAKFGKVYLNSGAGSGEAHHSAMDRTTLHLEIAAHAYGLTVADVQPLVHWYSL